MCVLPPDMSADQVLQAFYSDAPSLFLGAAIVAVGLVAASFSAIRRKPDALLIYFALFAFIYGARMWMKSSLIGLTMQDSFFYPRLRAATDFLVPIPAFLFLNAAGLLHRQAKFGGYVLGVALCLLAVATLAVGPRNLFYQINSVFIITALLALVVRAPRGSANLDFAVVRRGLLIFVAFAIWENVRGIVLPRWPNVEPIGFVVFLTALGYVAARQTLRRNEELNEIQRELEVARRIQFSILPAGFPSSANFHVAARYVPMTAVAGDFYDFIVADDHHAGLLIADVSGHGVPAALIASMVKIAATSQRAQADDPARLLAEMNSVLRGNTQEQFVTAAYLHLDSKSRTLRYSAAGHPPMLLLRNGEVLEIVENGLILAAFDFATYTNASHRLEPGDRFLLYTDGVIEAANTHGIFFGGDALSALLRQTAELTPSAASDQILSSVRQWSASQDDDLTVLICDYMSRNAG
jgi:phosphoserine phosphatase RsbU/P